LGLQVFYKCRTCISYKKAMSVVIETDRPGGQLSESSTLKNILKQPSALVMIA
jgi:hypothetical protein